MSDLMNKDELLKHNVERAAKVLTSTLRSMIEDIEEDFIHRQAEIRRIEHNMVYLKKAFDNTKLILKELYGEES